jgi:hypothetical protein
MFRAKTRSISTHAVRLEGLLQRDIPAMAFDIAAALQTTETRSDHSKQER